MSSGGSYRRRPVRSHGQLYLVKSGRVFDGERDDGTDDAAAPWTGANPDSAAEQSSTFAHAVEPQAWLCGNIARRCRPLRVGKVEADAVIGDSESSLGRSLAQVQPHALSLPMARSI